MLMAVDEEVLEGLEIERKWQRHINNSTLLQMHKERETLEKKLEIAVKALKKYADEDEWLDGCPIKPTALSFAKCCYAVNGYEEAQQALKEIEE